MMRKGTLTREQAIKVAGIDAVNRVDREDCEPTGRLQCDGDNDLEYSASVKFVDADGDCARIVAYYYVDGDWHEGLGANECGWEDLFDWEINGYEIV